ncbi:MAG TPA: 16S rRNA (cytosine(1402)-N(4))-methyltransferase, partial [Patescibacteria group bacterium]
MNNYHVSVLLNEAIEALKIRSGKQYIDATLGGGGHSLEIIKRGGRVLGLDVDQDALDFVSTNCQTEIVSSQLKIAKGNFKDIAKLAKENGFEQVAGVLFDLGVSSHHFDEGKRGF